MTENFTCTTCSGAYAAVQTDGKIYHHVCGPVIDPYTGAEVPRQNARNETVQLDKRGNPTGIVAEGAGVTPVTPNTLTEPSWITALMQSVQSEED